MKHLKDPQVQSRLTLVLGAFAVSTLALVSQQEATQGTNIVLPVNQRGLAGTGTGPGGGGGIPVSIIDDSTPIPPVGELGGPLFQLTGPDLDQWIRGRKLFDRDFHKSDGLGFPEMNADSCRACHQEPVIGGGGNLELNASRYGNDGGGFGVFQDPPTGQALSRFHPPFVAGREEYDPALATQFVFEQRQTPPLFGVGLIDAISDATILANEDPTDADGDGIFGVARMVDVGGGMQEVGRYGWKGQIPLISDFVRDAMAGECGLTTEGNGRPFGARTDGDPVNDPEISITQIDDMAFFINNLAAPPRGGNANDPQVLNGEALFGTVGCAKCHIPTLTGGLGPVDLYSDLLLHNIWPSNFRGMAEPGADVGFYQTPPLWGAKHSFPYMHDGRAETIEDAILLHDGEALAVRQAYEALSATDKEAVLAFLNDL